MRAMYANGRQAEALRVYASYRRYLADETGLDPSEEIIDLERRIARSDAGLHGGVKALRGYEVGERIGEGAFSVVHQQSPAGNPTRTLWPSRFSDELADQPDFIRRFEAEAHPLPGSSHPQLVPLFDFWREPGALIW